MATVQILKEDQQRAVLLINSDGSESDSVIVDASSLTGAKVGLSSYDLSVEYVSWVLGSHHVNLKWDATTDVTFLNLTGAGELHFKRDASVTIPNNAGTGKTGDILMNKNSSEPSTIIIGVRKSPASYTQYHSTES